MILQTLFSLSGLLQSWPFSVPLLPKPGGLLVSFISCRTQRGGYYLPLTFQKVREQCRASRHRKDTDGFFQGSRNLPEQPLPSSAPACCSGDDLLLRIPLPAVPQMPYSPQTPPSQAVRSPPPFPIAKHIGVPSLHIPIGPGTAFFSPKEKKIYLIKSEFCKAK